MKIKKKKLKRMSKRYANENKVTKAFVDIQKRKKGLLLNVD